MKRNWFSAMAVMVTLIVTAFLLFQNEIMIKIRVDELMAHLKNTDRSEASIDHIGLVATYEIHKKLFENRITQDSADKIEQKIDALRITGKDNRTPLFSLDDLLMAPTLGLMNFNRMVLGKTPLTRHGRSDAINPDLDLAYYYERNMHFNKAAVLYEKSLASMRLPGSLRASVLLHQGYCYALSDLNDKARANYKNILEKYGRENSAITAAILLQYLDGFAIARREVLAGSANPLLQSQKLVNLLAYKQALAILESAEKTAKPETSDSIAYFKGRCHAGLGNTQKAVENYLRVITSSPSSRYAKYSNRKLFMLGTKAENPSIKKISVVLNQRLKDPVLDQMIKETAASREPEPIAKSDIAVTIPPQLQHEIEMISSPKQSTVLKKGAHIVVHTTDGNTFKGILLEDTRGHVSLETSIGTINVKKDRISGITNELHE